MTPSEQVDCIVHDCFLAVGQMIGSKKQLDYDTIVWWHQRYREKFMHAVTSLGNSWEKDRPRVIAVGRYLGQRAQHHAGQQSTIDLESAAKASRDVESGCRMNAERDGLTPAS
jgi:hypothetical protein